MDHPDSTSSEPSRGLPPTESGLAGPASRGASGIEHRALFWQNVIREILNALAAAAAASAGRLGATPSAAAAGGSPTAELFDGRMAVITRLGQRIPIADVVPVFACSLNPKLGGRSPDEMRLADDVQCTVFQIRTPTGEVFTLPVSEIAAVHALSEHLIRKLGETARESRRGGDPDSDDGVPFGFAAFTSLARSQSQEGDGHTGADS